MLGRRQVEPLGNARVASGFAGKTLDQFADIVASSHSPLDAIVGAGARVDARSRQYGPKPAVARMLLTMRVEHFVLAPNDWVPNNQRLPVLIYRGALDVSPGDPASLFEELFEGHGWQPRWRDTIFDYHHYHSNVHEALGIAAGHARIMLGGPDALTVEIAPGDALVLPVGTGHCRLEAGDDLCVVGAYPDATDWDICRAAPDDAARARMADLAIPASDPVVGADSPLTRHWEA